MKILFLTTHLNIGGVSTYVVTLAHYLKKQGIDVICASGGGALVPELVKSGIRHYTISVRTKNELHIKMFFAYVKLLELIDQEEITHLHAHTRVTQVLGACVKCVRNVHFITTCHGFYKRRLSRRIFPAWGDRVIAISDPVREHLVNDFKVQKSRVALIYNGVEITSFGAQLTVRDKDELKKYFAIKHDGVVVGGVSRLEKIKGYQNLLYAMVPVIERYPTAQVLLVGDGKYRRNLQRLARSLGIDRHVVFTGKVESINLVLEVIDIFVHPCIWHEGFGLAILEAMAAGKPIISSNTGGTYALVKEGVNGWLLPPGDVAALRDAIVRFLENPHLIAEMGRHSQHIAQEQFSMERMAKQVGALYCDMENASLLRE